MLSPLLASLCAAALRLSEVMPDPSRVEDARGEWVELENAGDAAVWTGYRLVLSGADTIDVPRLAMPPGGFWTLGKVLQADNGGFVPDLVVPTGWTLPNGSGRIVLLGPDGSEVDAVDWEKASPGASLERCPDGIWRASGMAYGAGDKGTPGAPNSCDPSPRDVEGEVSGLERNGGELVALVRNRGRTGWPDGRVATWSADGTIVRRDTLRLGAGETATLRHVLPDSVQRARWSLALPPDARPADDVLAVWVRSERGAIVLAEIQPADPGPEWIELAQRLDRAVSLGGWTLGDLEPRARLPESSVLPAGGRLVLASDCAVLKALVGISTLPCVEPSPWPRLSVESDRLSLRDADGGLWDSVSWERGEWGAWPKDRTRERMELVPFGGPQGWLPSAEAGGTPGYGPAEASGWSRSAQGRHAFRLGSRRVRPGAEAERLRMEIEGAPSDELRLDLFDMGRRVVARVHEGAPPRSGVLLWDGRDGRGRAVRPGVYVLVAEFGPLRKPVWRTKEWIVVAPSR